MGVVLLAIGLVCWVVGYVVACCWWPFTACGKCEGGKRRSPSGKAWRLCGACKGSGKRIRTGRRAWTALTK